MRTRSLPPRPGPRNLAPSGSGSAAGLLELRLDAGRDGAPLSLLLLGAHADDIEIGCGGTLLRLAEAGVPVRATWVVLSASGARREEAVASAAAFLPGVELDVRIGEFRDAFFPHDPGVKEFVEALKHDVAPDIILTHTRNDLHQDHRVVCELAWNAFRDHLVLEYEVPKYDGDLGAPNVFVPLREEQVRKKARLLLEHFGSQRNKHWFAEDLFVSLARLRGVECRSPSGYAEGFYGRKVRVALPLPAC